MRPDLVITSLGDAERDVAIDVTVTSPFSVKRTGVVPLTAAKEDGNEQEEEVPGNLQRCWTAFLSLLLLRHVELQLMLQQGMSWTPSSRSQRVFPINWAASSPKAYWYQTLSLTLWATNARKVKPCLIDY